MGAEFPFEIRERSVYLPEADALVVADTHLGREADANVELPLGATASIRSRLLELISEFDPAEVVIAGDVLHAFSSLPRNVEEDLLDLRERIEATGADLVLIEGNHDTMLETIANPVSDYRLPDGSVVCHGHEPPGEEAHRYVIGHDHPAINVEGRRLPCHLWGPETYEGSDVLILPAFDELAAGTEVNGWRGRDARSPLLSGLDQFRPVVFDEGEGNPLTFPRLGDLREHL